MRCATEVTSVRRRWGAAFALVLVATTAAACGDDGGADDAGADTGSASASASASGTADGAFPVTAEHAFGSTEIPAAPERIVTVGLTEHDTVLALGLTPVGVTDWYGDQPYATWPWAQDELGDATPEVLTSADGIQLEKVAALDPDLIIGVNAGLTDDVYEELSQIAPTVAHPEGAEAYFSPWQDQTVLIGQALGMEDEARALVADIDQQFADAAAEHPEFAGTEVVFLQNAFYDGSAIAYQDGLSTEFLTDLGFTIPSEIDPFVQEAAQAYIPLEQLSVLDVAEVLVWGTESDDDRTALESEPLYNDLQAVKDGKLVFTDGLTAGAIYFTSPLSLPYVLDALVPALASTLAGDGPATTSSAAG